MVKLDRRINLEKQVYTVNDFNEKLGTWEFVKRVFASKKDISDGEKLRAGLNLSTLTARFLVRSSALAKTITADWRIEYKGRFYHVDAVKEADFGRGGFMEILATAKHD